MASSADPVPNHSKNIPEVITVEPVLVCWVIVPVICVSAFTNLQNEIACVAEAGYSEDVCDAIALGDYGNYTKQISHVYDLISEMYSWNVPVYNLLPMILVLSMGSLSDRRKIRKPFLLIPIAGEMICVASCMIATVFKKHCSLNAFGILLTTLPTFFGSPLTFQMAIYAYIADVSTLEMRTLRIGVIQVIWSICDSLGAAMRESITALLGNTLMLVLAEIIYLIGFLYGYFVVKESRDPVVDKNQKSLLADVFDPRHLVETFSLISKRIPGNNRLFILIITLVLFIIKFVHTGEEGLLYYYTRALYFWPSAIYFVYDGVSTTINCIGLFIGVVLFVKIMNFSDYVIINLSFLGGIIGGIILFFSKTAIVLYLVTCIQFLTGLAKVGVTSQLTKVTTVDNLGKAISLFSVAENIGQMLGSNVYDVLWARTKNTYPGTSYLLSSLLFVISMMFIMWKYVIVQKEDEKLQIISDRELETNATPMSYIQSSHF